MVKCMQKNISLAQISLYVQLVSKSSVYVSIEFGRASQHPCVLDIMKYFPTQISFTKGLIIN